MTRVRYEHCNVFSDWTISGCINFTHIRLLLVSNFRQIESLIKRILFFLPNDTKIDLACIHCETYLRKKFAKHLGLTAVPTNSLCYKHPTAIVIKRKSPAERQTDCFQWPLPMLMQITKMKNRTFVQLSAGLSVHFLHLANGCEIICPSYCMYFLHNWNIIYSRYSYSFNQSIWSILTSDLATSVI